MLRWIRGTLVTTWQTIIGPMINHPWSVLNLTASRNLSILSSETARSTSLFRIPRVMELKGRVIVFSIIGCPHCMRSKNSLQELKLPYTDISLEIYPQCRQELTDRTGKKTVPQIFFNSIHIGGNDDFQKLISTDKNKLDELIEEVKNNPPPTDFPVPPDPSTAVKDADLGDFVCEPDEYASLVRDLRASGLISDHRKGLSVHKHSFIGCEFVDWVVKTKSLDRSRAVEMGQLLIDKHFSHVVRSSEETFRDDKVFYRLLDDDESSALNAGTMSECEPLNANDLGRDLRTIALKLYSAFLSPDGKRVNYQGIAGSSEFETYVRLTKELQRVQLTDLTRQEKVAFFVNMYNALVIHASIVRGPATNLWQRYKFFNTVKYIIGGLTFSLQDMENGVLRGNRKGVGMFSRPFSKTDPRLKVALSECEPLVHFGLVCGAKSCPPIKTYTPEGVYDQLALAADAFLEGSDGLTVDVGQRSIQLSQIFKWYQQDFGSNHEEVVQWVYQHMSDSDKRSHLKEVMDGKKFNVNYMHYDWSINS